MSRLRKKKHLNVDVWKKGFVFTMCTVYESLKGFISKVGKNNPSVKEHEIKLKKHNIHHKSSQHLYHIQRVEFMQFKEDFLCITHDKMDHSKTTFLWLQVKNKMGSELGQLLVTLTGMIIHDHGGKAFV